MTSWPGSLPPPLRFVGINPAINVEAIEQASGRRIARNWGHRDAEHMTVQFRITQEQESAFKYFWHRAGMDAIWFTADWLEEAGYGDYKARILGYPRRKGITGKLMDFAVTLLLMPNEAAIDAEAWPSAGTGVPAPPSPDEHFIAVATAVTPYITVYPWNLGEGYFGSKFANPATLPTFGAYGVDFSVGAEYIAVAEQGTPQGVDVYEWLPGGGFGTKVSDPAIMPSGCWDVEFSLDGDYIALSHSGSPYVSVYPWNGAFGTRFSNPSTLPTADGVEVGFSPGSDYLAVGHQAATPYISVYPWSGSGFGTKVADPSPSPGQPIYSFAFSPNGSVIVLGLPASPHAAAYAWSSGFGTKLSDPGTPPAFLGGFSVKFTPDGNYVSIAGTASPSAIAYPWVGGFGTLLATPVPAASGAVSIDFSEDGDYVALGLAGTPAVYVYSWAGGFGERASNPTTLPGDSGAQEVKFGLQPGG